MILSPGEKIHLIVRRQFENDLRRHFVGEVEAVTEMTVKIDAYMFVFDPTKNEYVKRPEVRTKIVSLVDNGNIITVIPPHVELAALRYEMSANRRLVVTNGKDFSLDINEFGASR